MSHERDAFLLSTSTVKLFIFKINVYQVIFFFFFWLSKVLKLIKKLGTVINMNSICCDLSIQKE